MQTKDKVHGEGNYEATRRYNEATKRFVESGKVDQAARDAAPRNAEEAAQMKRAEQAALLRAKESPPMKEPSGKAAVDDPRREQCQRDASSH